MDHKHLSTDYLTKRGKGAISNTMQLPVVLLYVFQMLLQNGADPRLYADDVSYSLYLRWSCFSDAASEWG